MDASYSASRGGAPGFSFVPHQPSLPQPTAAAHQRQVTRPRLSAYGAATLQRAWDSGCHLPTKSQKDALLREVQQTDPHYTVAKLGIWFQKRRMQLREKEKTHDDVALKTMLDPTTALAREMWPSCSADTLSRMHDMLFEQPHLTVQHKELLANHFRIDKQHVENFINWRAACLPSDDLKSEHTQQQRKLSPASVAGTEDMDVDDYENTKPGPSAHLPTPAASISPEPKYRTIPLLDVEVSPRRPTLYSVDTGTSFAHDHTSWPPTPDSAAIQVPQSFALRPVQTWSPAASERVLQHAMAHLPSPPPYSPHPPPRTQRTQPQPAAPLLPTNAPSQDIARPSESASAQSAGSSALARPAAPSLASLLETGLSLPHTLHELDEAYAPTYAKIERFFKAVEEGRYARFGLTPELLESVER